MKKTYQTILILTFLAGCVFSCSEDHTHIDASTREKETLPVSVQISRAATEEPELTYSLWIFSRAVRSEEEYILNQFIPAIRKDSRLKFTNQQIKNNEFRCLFTATPQETPEIQVSGPDLTTLPATGSTWSGLRIQTLSSQLSSENYYQVKDMTGEEIAGTDTIQGTLTRLVGQMVFDIFKIGTDINHPHPIDTARFGSVFDRVYKIEISYTNHSHILSFEETQPIPVPSASRPVIQTILPELNAKQQLDLPQAYLDTLNKSIAGGGRIKGLYLLPSSGNLQVQLTFYYYDTTPTCGQPDETHTIDCFGQRQLQLNLPADASLPGLPVHENAYTVNKAGIRCDRIIDIQTNSGLDIQTDWNKN